MSNGTFTSMKLIRNNSATNQIEEKLQRNKEEEMKFIEKTKGQIEMQKIAARADQSDAKPVEEIISPEYSLYMTLNPRTKEYKHENEDNRTSFSTMKLHKPID